MSGLFLISGIDKVLHPAAFVATVERMALFPDFLVRFSWVMGLIETTKGAAILLRSLRILAIKAIILLMGIFTLVTVGLILKNYRGDCGCMPWAGWTGWASVAKQGVILAVSAALLRGTASHSLDKPLVPVQTGDIT